MKRPFLHGAVVGCLLIDAAGLWICGGPHVLAVATGVLGLIFAGFDVRDMVTDRLNVLRGRQ